MTVKDDISIRVRGLSKEYRIAHKEGAPTTAAEALARRLRHPLERQSRETFRALSNIDLDVSDGDILGVVGRNGAGKSTLLKILARITSPTEGRIDVFGRVGSLLEVGTGFHPELTGRENIFLNGAVLGMTPAQVRRQFDAIVAFAGVERFLDTQVKRYSTGMYIRLAFAVAAHLEADILLVDEVLAVGDAQFQEKCIGKMKDVAGGGRTVLFVSHQMQSVTALCNRAIVLGKGQIDFDGDVTAAVDRYLASFQEEAKYASDPNSRPGTGEARITHARCSAPVYPSGEPKRLDIVLEVRDPSAESFRLVISVVNHLGIVVCECDSSYLGTTIDGRIAGPVSATWTLKTPWLQPGRYRIDIHILRVGPVVDAFEAAATFDVADVLPYPHTAPTDAGAAGLTVADYDIQLG